MHALGLQSQVVNAGTLEEYERAFARLKIEGVNGVLLLQDPSNTEHAGKIAELAQQHRLPTAFQLRENVAAGGLMSYGVDINDQFRLAAFYVDRILRGEKPADLPVQLPTKFELVINLKAAKALGRLDVLQSGALRKAVGANQAGSPIHDARRGPFQSGQSNSTPLSARNGAYRQINQLGA
jgi:ABC-type uncharacterized transport system substrate-binding protein